MQAFKCKICGGAINLDRATGIAVCEYCGTKQALPMFFDDSTRHLYESGNYYLQQGEYDQAETIFNQLLAVNPQDAEIYWNIVMCRYALEFVSEMEAGGGINEHAIAYKIKDTDIQLLLMDFDLANTSDYFEMDQNSIGEFAVFAIIAPADLISPQNIGNEAKVYDDDGVLYVPNVSSFALSSNYFLESSPEYNVSFRLTAGNSNGIITKSDLIGVASRASMGGNNYNSLTTEMTVMASGESMGDYLQHSYAEASIGLNMVIADPNLRVRSEPNTESSIIGKLEYGVTVEILETDNGWGAIIYDGQIGWVSMEYLTSVAG